MSNKFEDIDIKSRTYYLFDNIINIKLFVPNNSKIDEKWYINILISKYMKINSVNPSYFIINKVNGNFEDINKNKYLTLVPSNESNEKIKKYEELRSKIKDLIRSVTKNADNYDKKYIKIKINSDGDLPLNKMTEIHGMVPTAVAFFSSK